MPAEVIEIEPLKAKKLSRPSTNIPGIVRFTHWANAIALFVMVGSGFQIFRAFPSFGAKIPQKDLLHWPKAFAIGGWLGGALQWHLTFMWIYIATGVFYLGYQIFSGNYRQVLFSRRDVRWSLADGAPLLFLRPKAACDRGLQSVYKNWLTRPPSDWVC